MRQLVLLVLGVWMASIPVAEGVFRLLGERTTTDMAGLYQPFGDGGYSLRPNVSGTADTLLGRYSVFTNSLGLRCAAGQSRETPPGPVDILVLGDSQAFGNGLNFEDSLVGQFAARAAAQGLHLENAAIGGQYLANQFELARWLDARGVRPRRILLFLTPYLIATAGEYNRVSVGRDGRLYSRGRGPGVTSWLKRHTVIYGRLRNAVNGLVPLAKDELTPLAVKIYLKRNKADYRDHTLRSLEALSRWARERGVSLAIAYTPMAVEVAFDGVRQAAVGIAGGVDPNVPFEVAQSAAEALGIKFYDLRSALARRAAEHEPLTLPADAHYDAATSAACAESLWTAVAGQNAALTAAMTNSKSRRAASPTGDPAWN